MTAGQKDGPSTSSGQTGTKIRPLHLLLGGIAAAALAGPALIVANAPPIRPAPRLPGVQQRVVPPAELPPVEPTEFVALPPEDARAFNATVPFSTGPNPAARPFRFAGSAEDLARATDCLAAAVIYEAGDDAVGERAVAQVILNRLRHPVFPKTVCGVVFQGHERSTGCQFTFTCDGALGRWRPTPEGWRRAREIAAMALGGSVYAPVGHATHYHTDWVVPYWSSSLDKIVAVGTHLFFRWTGWWGTPPAFNRRWTGGEPNLPKMAFLSPAHAGTAEAEEAPDELAEANGLLLDDPALTAAATAGPAGSPEQDSFLLTLPRGLSPELWPSLAARTCGERAYCKVLAWSDPAKTPRTQPIAPAQVATLSFSYLRDRAGGLERTLWNCQEAKRPDPSQCMKRQVYLPTAVPVPAATPSPTKGPEELKGVRRKAEPTAAAPTPAPAPAEPAR